MEPPSLSLKSLGGASEHHFSPPLQALFNLGALAFLQDQLQGISSYNGQNIFPPNKWSKKVGEGRLRGTNW